jgi:alpha-beta hydrolase superfamily lysophospholipase
MVFTMPDVFTVVDDDEIPISVYRWDAPGSVTGAVHVVHGLGEHALRYDRFAGALNAVGYTVTAHDQRGHGRTADATGGLGHLGPRGMEGTLDSLHTVTRTVHDLEPDVPFFLLGHSWGSMLAQKFAIRWGGELTGLVLSGTTLMEPGFLPPADLNAPFVPGATDYDWLSRDADEVRRYVDDPLCGFQPDFPWEEMAFLVGGPTDAVPGTLPILIVNGSVDPVGGEAGGAALTDSYRASGVSDVTFHSYPEARHELFNETNRDEVVADVISWLDTLSSPADAAS